MVLFTFLIEALSDYLSNLNNTSVPWGLCSQSRDWRSSSVSSCSMGTLFSSHRKWLRTVMMKVFLGRERRVWILSAAAWLCFTCEPGAEMRVDGGACGFTLSGDLFMPAGGGAAWQSCSITSCCEAVQFKPISPELRWSLSGGAWRIFCRGIGGTWTHTCLQPRPLTVSTPGLWTHTHTGCCLYFCKDSQCQSLHQHL